MRRTPPPPARRAFGPALRHDAEGSPYLDYRTPEPLPPEPGSPVAPDEEPTEPRTRVATATPPGTSALPPIFSRRCELGAEPGSGYEAQSAPRGLRRVLDWLFRAPRSATDVTG